MMESEYRSMDLLWRVYPEAAKKLVTAWGAGLVIIYDFESICDPEHLDLYICFSQFLGQFTDSPEKYMVYKSISEAFEAYNHACEWLYIYEVPERFIVFEVLTLWIMYLDYYSDDEDEYIELLALIHDLASPMHIDGADICAITTCARDTVLSDIKKGG